MIKHIPVLWLSKCNNDFKLINTYFKMLQKENINLKRIEKL